MALTDLSNLKAPGWGRVVAELTAPAQDDRLFLLRLVGVLGQVSGARQAVLFVLTGPQDDAAAWEPRPVLTWPLSPDVVDAQGRATLPAAALFDPTRVNEASIEQIAELKKAARSVAGTRQPAVFGLDAESQMYDTGTNKGYVLAVPVPAGMPAEAPNLPLHGVVTLLIENRSKQAVQTTLALVEVLTGYIFAHATQQALRRTRASSAALDLAARLIASINQTTDFKGATFQFVNDLARQLAVDRAALGWVKGGNPLRTNTDGARSVSVIALSDTENVDRRMAMVRKLETAMDECLDQEQAVLYPPPPADADSVLATAITHAHRELASADASLKVASFPLRVGDPTSGDKVIGVILIEGGGDGRIDPATVELVQATLDLVSPVLAVRHSDDRVVALRAWDWAVRTAAWAVGSRHTVWKAAAVLVFAAAMFLCFYTTTYRVGAPMELQPRERRTVSMPFDGTIIALGDGAIAGAPVQEGQLLVQLDTHEMALSRMEADAQVTQFSKQAEEALRKGELADAAQHKAKADQSRARRDLMARQIERSRILAPISGSITAGELRDKINASAKLGERLFEVADTTNMEVIARVDDRDIALIGVGTTGELSPKSAPSMKVPFVVEQVVPLAQARDGQNSFEVRGRITGDQPAKLLPGMQGQAKFNTQEHSLAWIGSRRVLDTLRVWLWW